MKKIIGIVLFFAIAALFLFVGTGFAEREDVILLDYAVSEDGTELTFQTALPSPAGYVRGFSDNGGGMKPHYLTFYSTFGGLNSSFGAENVFTLPLAEGDTEIYFNRPDGGYTLVLQKDAESGAWVRGEG